MSYSRSGYRLHGLLVPHLLHGRVVLLLVVGHEHLERSSCVKGKETSCQLGIQLEDQSRKERVCTIF